MFQKKIRENPDETLTKPKTAEKEFDKIVQEMADHGLIIIEREDLPVRPRKPGRPIRTYYQIPFLFLGEDAKYITPEELPAAFDEMQKAYGELFDLALHLLGFVSISNLKEEYKRYSNWAATPNVEHYPPEIREKMGRKREIPKMPKDAGKWQFVKRVR